MIIKEFENDIIDIDEVFDKIDEWKFFFNNNVKIMKEEKDIFSGEDINNEKRKIQKLQKMMKLLKQLEDLQSSLY